jgi:hypothetical protein
VSGQFDPLVGRTLHFELAVGQGFQLGRTSRKERENFAAALWVKGSGNLGRGAQTQGDDGAGSRAGRHGTAFRTNKHRKQAFITSGSVPVGTMDTAPSFILKLSPRFRLALPYLELPEVWGIWWTNGGLGHPKIFAVQAENCVVVFDLSISSPGPHEAPT